MNTKKFTVQNKEIALYPAEEKGRPLIVFNIYTGDGSSVMQEIRKLYTDDFSLLAVGDLIWDMDMTPWECASLSENGMSRTGGADKYLDVLLSEILPAAKEFAVEPSYIGIAGYSLAGLFALYAMYRCDVFGSAASMSGSLWFPDFKEYVLEHDLPKKPRKLYLSLGDKEAHSRSPLFKTVGENTEAIAEHYRRLGINTVFEMNRGNHFNNADMRSAKGIAAILINN